MSIFATINDAGFVTGFYHPDPDRAAPNGSVEIDEQAYLHVLEYPQTRRWDGTAWVAYSPPPVPVDLYALAASLRWQKEIGGIVVGGVTITTDDRSKTLLQGARTAADANPDHIEGWKTADGWVDLTAAQIIAMSDAVRAHVSACFRLERTVSGQIADGTITTPAQVEAAFA